MLCTSSESTNACEVVFSSFSLDMQMARVLVTIEIANTDFGSSNEYISSITVGGTRVGGHYLEHDGVDGECTKMSRVLDAVPVEMVDAGPPVVKIETSSAVDSYPCHGYYIFARVSLTYLTHQMPCEPCEAGKYSIANAGNASTDCQICPPGTYSGAGSTSCSHCQAGKFAFSTSPICLLYTSPSPRDA